MHITEDMVSPHHLLAAERWIAENGIPQTDADMARMGQEVAEDASQTVEHMACKAFEALDAHQHDKEHGVETLQGMQGRELLHDVYTELRRRA